MKSYKHEYYKSYLTYNNEINIKNHWANFNQTWHNASLGDGDSSLFK